jgi:hypothetical protein
MESSHLKLQQVVKQLPPQHLAEVISFAEFLSFKAMHEDRRRLEQSSRSKHLELPMIKDVKYIGDPLLRREELYDEWGR